MRISGLGELKTRLLEVIVVLFGVTFLKVVLEAQTELEWTMLVIPIGMLVTGIVIWILRHSERHLGTDQPR